MAEIIPFEPDAVSTDAGKSLDLTIFTSLLFIFNDSIMDIFINNQKTEIGPGQTLRNLLLELKIDAPKGIAIAINNNIIPKNVWENHYLQKEDRVTIIKATQGG